VPDVEQCEDEVNGVSLSEARGADSGGGVLGEGAASPLPTSKGVRERYKLPQLGPWLSSGRSTISAPLKPRQHGALQILYCIELY